MSVRPYRHHVDKWIVEWYIPGGKGKRDSVVIEGTEASARAYEAEMRRRQPDAISINPRILDVLADFHGYYRTNRLPTTYADCIKSFKHLSKHIGNHRFTGLSPTVIEEYKMRRLDDKVSRRTINKELSYLSSFLKWAVKNNHCNPLTFKIEKFEKIRSPKPEVPSPEVVQTIINKIEKEYRPILLLLYDGGLRRTEALTLTAERINLDTRLMMVKGKGEKERVVPITTGRLFEALSKLKKKIKDGFLFANPRTGKPYDSIRKPLARACKKAKVTQRIYHHLFRHSFGTHATVAGVGLKHLQDIMGHSTSKTTELYTHLAAERLTEESKKFARYIDEQEKPKPRKTKGKSKP